MDDISKFPKVLLDVVAGIVESDASDKEKVHEVLDTLQTWPGASRLTESEVHVGEFHLRLDLPGRTRERAGNLRSIEGLGLGLAVAPEVVALVDVVPADTLLVSRYGACAGSGADHRAL